MQVETDLMLRRVALKDTDSGAAEPESDDEPVETLAVKRISSLR